MQDELLQTGSVIVEDVIIVNQYDRGTGLKEFFTEINIFEDMYSPCLFAEILITDNINLISTFPIVGGELVVIKFRTPTFEDTPPTVFEKTFYVSGIKNRTVKGDTQVSYLLELISQEGYIDLQTTVTGSFSGTTDEVAAKIFEDYLTVSDYSYFLINDPPHNTKIKYTSNFWSPFKNLSYISKRCQSYSGIASDFLFFETKNAFMLASPESLIKKQRIEGLFDEYVYELVPGTYKRKRDGNSYYGTPVSDEMTRVISIKVPRVIDSVGNLMNGYYANAVRSYDLTTKKITETTFDMSKDAQGFFKTADGTAIPQNVNLNPYNYTSFVPVNSSLYTDYGITNNTDLPEGHPADYIIDKTHYRHSYLNSLLATKFSIQIHGRTDMAVGMCINFLYPSTGTKLVDATAADAVDKYLSGVFLITAIRHFITNDKHTMQVEIVKNGFNEAIN